ncbi:two-component regulator propeller domain-containing protein [Maribacter sp. 2307UL18-2]|uniref:two-component regulator propeller domain-containing protein n=1 Tax=Maribacter sp. 2307UL18-2 TaxID=3386274 RepID=UPI0039BCCC31
MRFEKALYRKVMKFLLLLMLGIHMQAQNIKFEHYNDNDGLSHNSVRHILQDENGFLWLGTFSGLNRFDGQEFKGFGAISSNNTIQSGDITALELDNEMNQLWIGTRNGLIRLDMHTQAFSTFLPDSDNPNSLPDPEIRSIHIDRFSRVWIGTKDNGLFIYYPGQNTFKKIPLPNFQYIKEIFEDSMGNIWIGSYKTAGIVKIELDQKGAITDRKNYTLTVPESEEVNPYVNFIYEDTEAAIFVGTREGLYRLNEEGDEFENLYIEDETVRDKIGPHFISVARSPEGNYWLGTLGGILVVDRLEDVALQNFEWYYSELSDDDTLVDDLISALFFDASGVLWVGTENGFDKYDPFENQFKTNKEISKYIENQVPRIRGFSKTFDGKIVVATRHNGLFISENESYIPLYKGMKDIASIQSFDGKTFYCGLWSGEILVYDYLKNRTAVLNVGFQQDPVLSFAKIGENKMVVGSHGEGLVAIDIETLEVIDSPGISSVHKEVNKILVDDVGKIWIATQDGVFRYDSFSEKTKSYKANSHPERGLLHNNVSDLAKDNNGRIWAATRNGLNYYDESLDDFLPATMPTELQGRWITDVISDENDLLWLNMNNNQVASYDVDTHELKTYHANSGNRLDVFSLSGFYYSDDSHIYLGGKDGVISFSPSVLKDNDYSPPPMITSVSVQNKEIKVGSILNDQKILDKDINSERKLRLKNVNKNFAFTFSSPSYVNERANKYSYILEGFDESWNTVDVNQRTVQYTNLFFGDYVFKVRAMNSHGVWSDPSVYEVAILPPFWLTYKAWILLLLILTLLFYLIRRQIKIRLELKQQLLMEKVKRERDEKLNNEKLRFFTNISHEIRTPLTLILGPIKQLLEENKETTNHFQKRKFDLIHQNTNRLLNLVDQVLDFRKSKTGKLRLKVSKTDIAKHTKTTFETFEEFAEDRKIQFNYISEIDDFQGYIDRDKYDKILYNLLSNAFKFTHEYGNVDLFLTKKTENNQVLLVVEVSDNGIGIPSASHEKIFTRFYQAKNSTANNTGAGIGLSFVKALVSLHKGTIAVQSSPDQGSLFTLKLPIERDAYLGDEIFEYGQNRIIDESPQLTTAKKIIQGTDVKERILIVEDNSELRAYLVDYLSDFYRVFQAENGKEALRICAQIKPILCVADVMMPIMDGLQFCDRLKNDATISHIPVILLTALSENADKIKGFTYGADGYLVKPFEPSLLRSRIENVIRSRKLLKARFSEDIESEVSLIVHSPIDEDLMARLNVLIEENMGNTNLNSSFLCAEIGMSSSKLYRKIKELTGLAPNEFIRTIRLKKSAKLLKTKKYNVSEVTDHVGFSDPLYFSRCFKKQFGYPPSQLIK